MDAGAKPRRTEEFCTPVALVAALDACTQSIAVLENRRVLYTNPAFKKVVGIVGNSDLRGRLLTELVPQDPRSLDQLFAVPRDQGQIEPCLPNFETNDRIFQVFCAPSMLQSDSRTLPIPELQATETGRLVAAGIAHDFGNVLTAILLYSDLLVEGLVFDARLHHLAEAVLKAAHCGSSLVKKLMHPSCEEVVAAPPTSWNEVVSDMRSLLIRLVGEDIEMQTTLARNLGYVQIDANRAQQAILSLVSNARHAMPQGGKITITTRNITVRVRNSSEDIQTTRWVDLAVADTGVGMDENTLAQVFRAFFTTKPSNQGTGVGLTMVHDFVRQSGGKVEVKTRLGKGTRVTVRMPRITVK